MNNSYLVLRHGQSKANEVGIVLSYPEEGKKIDYTLTPIGEDQVHDVIPKSRGAGALDDSTIIVTSPFSRCLRTAEIAKEVLSAKDDIVIDERLRERWFGDLEKTSNTSYEKVWLEDVLNPDHTTADVESARSVQERTMSLMHDLENRYSGRTILLISHADVLRILLMGIQGRSSSQHNDIQPLEIAEIRRVEV
jgi:probable phosphoglycerate mutase